LILIVEDEMPPPVESQPVANPFKVGDLSVDVAARRVSLSGHEVHLSSTEFSLLATLVFHAGRVVTYRFLLNQLWNSDASWKIAYLKLLVSSLRHKLELDPARPRYVLTERGVGYRLAAD
jgi:two-component system, OmpR family, KDP operon response regulator KdpE